MQLADILIGRVIFTQHLSDREIVSAVRLKRCMRYIALPAILRDRSATSKLLEWGPNGLNRLGSGVPRPR
ncbi:N-6 DNA methylase [Paraburkholderia hospita]|uniref:N-6 DNA methylase n=1 Tax=Paraburkholderia hospita TaxID=169430 RepID=A0ABN0F5I9_9BURK|nr:N-6 DNA methylase [Paraburkholderia hospita]